MSERDSTTPNPPGGTRRVRIAALLLIAGLAAGPIGTHVYWMLGGTWGLGRSTTPGIRLVAVVVVLLLVAAVLVVLARIGLWQQAYVSDRVVRLLAWGLAVFFLLHGSLSLVEGWVWNMSEWWLYGPTGLVLALLAFVVAGSGGAWRIHRPHRTLPTH